MEDKSTYQLTAKEALRKVYQDRCDAMEMLSKMEMAYTTSDNECGILRGQIVSSKQTLQEFNTRLEQLQQEYADFKQDSLRQQQEAKEQEDQRLGQLKEQLVAQEQEMEQLRQQLMRLQQSKAEQDSDHALQQQQALEQLNAAIEEEDDDDDDDDGEHEEEKVDNVAGNDNRPENETQKTPSKQDKSVSLTKIVLSSEIQLYSLQVKQSKRQLKEDFNLKNKVVRKDTMLKWLKNSDLNKGAEGGDVLKAIFNNDDADSGDEDQMGAGTDEQQNHEKEEDALASDEFIHKSPKHDTGLLNGMDEAITEDSSHKLETQPTLVERSGSNDEFDEQFQTYALDMLQEECQFYKQKSKALGKNICELKEQMIILKQQLKPEMLENNSEENQDPKDEEAFKEMDGDPQISSWRAELNEVKDEELEEELIVYKERLAQSEIINFQLINELSDLRLKQPTAGSDHQMFLRHILPLGFVALAAIIYFLTTRF